MEHHNHHMTDHHNHENKTKLVVILTSITMAVEIWFGYYTNSMALLADGWHMSSHALALGMTWIAYVVARKYAVTKTFSFAKEKLLALSGFSSALILLVIAVIMAIESIQRLLHPLPIRFDEAIFVAVIGLLVNALSAVFLHHKHEDSDHNIRAAYLHVLADGLTSITAIVALLAGMYFNLYSFDAFSGIISAVIITKWSIGLMRDSGKSLIDFKKI